MKIEAIDGKKCEETFIQTGCDPNHLASFLRKYPAAFYLSWVKCEIAKWHVSGYFDNLKLLHPGKGQRKSEMGLIQAYTDFLIYKEVRRHKELGNTLSNAFIYSTDKTFLGNYFSWQHIRNRYYRFLRHKPASFIDDDKKLICGPTRIEAKGLSIIGFWEYTPDSGFKEMP